jgi:predicted 3-demethylubiquinone-9 3-methyltransferase (glyoxalase superfamily)
MAGNPKIVPCLWCDFNAEEMVAFYLDVFQDARVLASSRYPESMPGVGGKALMIEFELAGAKLQALNAGPNHPFTDAISLSVACEDQAEVDRLWARLTADGGSPGPCGWLKDRFGLSWQIVPPGMGALLGDPDPERAGRAMRAMMGMSKIDVAAIRRAADGEAPAG